MSFNSKYTGAQVEELFNKIPTSGNIWTSENDGSGSGLDADTLDGVQYQNILERGYSSLGNFGTALSDDIGWVRIAESLNNDTSNAIITISRSYQYAPGESYTFLITGHTSSIQITQLGGFASKRLITKVRAEVNGNGTCYFDFYIGVSSTMNKYFWTTIGAYKSLDPVVNPTTTGTIYEYDTTDGNVANKFQTPRTIWGQSFDGTGNVSGGLSLGENAIYGKGGASVLSAGGDLAMIGYGTAGKGWPTYIDGNVIYFRYSPTHNVAMMVNSSGNVGIGTITPAYRLDVNGNIHTNSTLTQDSDIRLKDINKDILLSIEDIANAPLFEFIYKSDKDKRIHVGTSAQYWAEKNNWFCKKQDNGYYDMEVQNLALASAISIAKEFKSYKEETESTISNMKKEIEELKQIVLNMNK